LSVTPDYCKCGYREDLPQMDGEPLFKYAMRVAKATYTSLVVDSRGMIWSDCARDRWMIHERGDSIVFRTGKGPSLFEGLWERLNGY
jgi:hypothetical protein